MVKARGKGLQNRSRVCTKLFEVHTVLRNGASPSEHAAFKPPNEKLDLGRDTSASIMPGVGEAAMVQPR